MQALKIISLCGWEARLLPYAVDSEDQPSGSSGEVHGEKRTSSIVYRGAPSEAEGGNNNWPFRSDRLAENQYDPASVVLDCKFCGACVGLWAFTTVQRPLECFTLTADPNGHDESETRCTNLSEGSKAESSFKGHQGIGSTSNERSIGLNLTIAGGPLPTKQNFRPIVSFPLISRHLRAEFTSTSGIKDCSSSQLVYGNQENTQVPAQVDDISSQKHINVSGDPDVLSEDVRPLKRKRDENELVSGSNDGDVPSHSDKELLEISGLGTQENSRGIAFDSTNCNTKEVLLSHGATNHIVNSVEINHSVDDDSHRSDTNSHGTVGDTLQEKEIPTAIEVGESVCTTSNADVIIRDSKASNSVVDLGDTCNSHERTSKVDLPNTGGTSGHDPGDALDIASCSSANASNITQTTKADRSSDLQDLQNAKASDQKTKGMDSMSPPANRNNEKADHGVEGS